MTMKRILRLCAISCLFLLASCGDSGTDPKYAQARGYDPVSQILNDPRNGQTYKTVKIGDQVWMAQNLNFETLNSYCYKDSVEYCAKYGRLYIWSAAVARSEDECGYGRICSLGVSYVQGVCPDGWHLPSADEWNILLANAGGVDHAARLFQSQIGWLEGKDVFGFAALPSGCRDDDGYYFGEGERCATFWSSTEYGSGEAYYMDFSYDGFDVHLGGREKGYGLSVRCIKN